MTTKRLAISYVRFSSKKQEQGDSTRRQRELADAWMARNSDEYEWSGIKYEDLGLSASKGKHLEGNLGKILEAVRSGDIPAGSAIVCETLDRFSRLEPLKTLRLLEEVIEAGVDLITLAPEVRYDRKSVTSHELFMLAGQALAAYDYAKTLGRRVQESYEGRAKEARQGGSIKRRNAFWLTSEGELKGDEANVVRSVFKSFAEGVGIRTLYKQHSDVFANPSSVRKLLKNIAVIGHWQRYTTSIDKDGKQTRELGELVKGVFKPALQDEALFYQVQKLMTKQPELTHAKKNPLSGIVVCATCGGNFAKRNAVGKNATDTMSCFARMTKIDNCTNSKSYPLPVLGDIFFETMKGHLLQSMKAASLSDMEKERIVLEADLERVKQAKRKLLQLGDDEDEELAEAFAREKEREQRIKAAIAALPTDGVVGIDPIDFYARISGDPFALTKTLQIGGYRIECGEDGSIRVGGDVFTYSGYNRGAKAHEYKDASGAVHTVYRPSESTGGHVGTFVFNTLETDGLYEDDSVSLGLQQE